MQLFLKYLTVCPGWSCNTWPFTISLYHRASYSAFLSFNYIESFSSKSRWCSWLEVDSTLSRKLEMCFFLLISNLKVEMKLIYFTRADFLVNILFGISVHKLIILVIQEFNLLFVNSKIGLQLPEESCCLFI